MSEPTSPVAEYIKALLQSERLGRQVCHHRLLPGREAGFAEPRRPWPKAVREMLAARGIDALYGHQALAADLVRAGRHVVVATPTASGKTFAFQLPIIEAVLANPDSRAIAVYPLKALAQDQLRGFLELTGGLDAVPEARRPTAAIYDGDTTPSQRAKIRKKPPNLLLTNPEMLHLSMLPHHGTWAQVFATLTHVVLDEVHTYRGVLGAHMSQVLRRFQRICRYYGSDPAYVFCSATVGNPAELCRMLTGLDAVPVTESGAPAGARHMVFLNPEDSPAGAAIQLLQAALSRGLKTIVYAQSRRMTELIALWASEKSGQYRDKISAYRAGFLPEERREIEARMSSGELLAVISTSALELGIDIGGLDVCILVGYPGSVMATLQRRGRAAARRLRLRRAVPRFPRRARGPGRAFGQGHAAAKRRRPRGALPAQAPPARCGPARRGLADRHRGRGHGRGHRRGGQPARLPRDAPRRGVPAPGPHVSHREPGFARPHGEGARGARGLLHPRAQQQGDGDPGDLRPARGAGHALQPGPAQGHGAHNRV
jgi:DEAD/DEAH box helicase domain-containing protein